MPIPQQFVFQGKTPGVPFPVPELPGEMETYPFEEATETVEASGSDWDGVAQLFNLTHSSAQFVDPYVWAEFYSELPAIAGYAFKVGLYRRVSDESSSLLAMSRPIVSTGAPGGFKRVKLLPVGSSSVTVIAGETYQAALLISWHPEGKFVFRCKHDSSPKPWPCTHITSPGDATVETPDSQLMTVGYGSWHSSNYIWFSIARAATAEYEVIP